MTGMTFRKAFGVLSRIYHKDGCCLTLEVRNETTDPCKEHSHSNVCHCRLLKEFLYNRQIVI